MPARLLHRVTTTPAEVPGPAAPARAGLWSLPEVRWAALATVLFAAGLTAHFSHGPGWLAWAAFLGCYGAGGWEPGLAGVRALRQRTLDVDLLMVAAAIAAAAVGQVLDGGLLIVIFATSGALEAVATHRTAQAVRGLLDLAPDQAIRLTGTGAEEIIDAASLRIGDVILVRPGERSCSSRESSSGTRSAWSPRRCCCSRSRCWPGRRSSPLSCAR